MLQKRYRETENEDVARGDSEAANAADESRRTLRKTLSTMCFCGPCVGVAPGPCIEVQNAKEAAIEPVTTLSTTTAASTPVSSPLKPQTPCGKCDVLKRTLTSKERTITFLREELERHKRELKLARSQLDAYDALISDVETGISTAKRRLASSSNQ